VLPGVSPVSCIPGVLFFVYNPCYQYYQYRNYQYYRYVKGILAVIWVSTINTINTINTGAQYVNKYTNKYTCTHTGMHSSLYTPIQSDISIQTLYACIAYKNSMLQKQTRQPNQSIKPQCPIRFYYVNFRFNKFNMLRCHILVS
jgi:hypothetical protein